MDADTKIFSHERFFARLTFDAAGEFIEVEMAGLATPSAMAPLIRASLDFPGWSPRTSQLLTLTDALQIPPMDPDELAALARQARALREDYYAGAPSRIANLVLAPRYLPFIKILGYLHGGHPSLDIRVFENRGQAVNWLTAPDWMNRPRRPALSEVVG